MRALVVVLACLCHTGSAIIEDRQQSLKALATYLSAHPRTLRASHSNVRRGGSPSTTQEALKLRGGSDAGIPIAKAFAALAVVVGGQAALAPKSTYKSYGFSEGKKKKDKPANELMELVMTTIGSSTLAGAILSAGLINGMDVSKAIGWSYVPWVLQTLKFIKTNKATKVGMPAWTQKFALVQYGAFLWAFLSGKGGPQLAKIAGGWTIFNGLLSALAPKKFIKNWGLKPSTEILPGTLSLLKSWGYNFVSFGILQAFGHDTELSKVLAAYFAVILAGQADSMFVSKLYGKAGMDLKPLYVFALIQAAAVGALLY